MENPIVWDKKKTTQQNFKIKCEKIALIFFFLHIEIGAFTTLSVIKITLSELSPFKWQSWGKNMKQTKKVCFFSKNSQKFKKTTHNFLSQHEFTSEFDTTLKICTFYEISRPIVICHLEI